MQLKGRFDDPAALEAGGVRDARLVVILAEREGDRRSDSETFDVVHRLTEFGVNCRIVAECVDDLNRDRLRKAGAAAVVRPMRGYPEMIVRAIVAPGAEQIMERLFSSEGDECLRFDVILRDLTWSHVVQAVVKADFGTPLGFSDEAGQLHTNPSPNVTVSGRALYVLVDETQFPSSEKLAAVLQSSAKLSSP